MRRSVLAGALTLESDSDRQFIKPVDAVRWAVGQGYKLPKVFTLWLDSQPRESNPAPDHTGSTQDGEGDTPTTSGDTEDIGIAKQIHAHAFTHRTTGPQKMDAAEYEQLLEEAADWDLVVDDLVAERMVINRLSGPEQAGSLRPAQMDLLAWYVQRAGQLHRPTREIANSQSDSAAREQFKRLRRLVDHKSRIFKMRREPEQAEYVFNPDENVRYAIILRPSRLR